MIFSTYTFLAFFIAVFTIQWFVLPAVIPERYRLRTLHVFLLISSYIFYMFSVWEYGLLIAASTLLDYIAGRVLGHYSWALPEPPAMPAGFSEERARSDWEAGRAAKSDEDFARARRLRRLVLLGSLGMNLGMLGYFKYADFFIESAVAAINSVAPGTFGPEDTHSLLLRVILPVGISFFTFQSMSYTIDVYRGVMYVERSLLRFALFVSFFPQLVAGPIVTAKTFLPQLDTLPVFDLQRMRSAARWFALGYFKKVVLADNMAPIVDRIYAQPELYDAAGHWLGAFAFWVQVYCDFSGYSDMAWGTAIFLGYTLPENFRLPYLSKSITEHWQRWHMSLISWNRDYLYFPLGGNRVSPARHKFNVWFTMWAAGVWHGANWTFVIWGAIHGTLLAIESWWKEFTAKRRERAGLSKAPRPERGKWFTGPGALAQFAITSTITIIFGTMFRAENIGEAWMIMLRMFGFGMDAPDFVAATLTNSMIRTVAWGIAATYAGHVIGWWIFEKGKLRDVVPAWVEILLAPVFILVCYTLGYSGTAPFIYFVF